MEEQTSDIKQKRIFGLPKNIFLLGLTSLFNDFSAEMVFSILPAFFTSVLHAGAQSLGLVNGIADGLSNFFKIYSGNLSDKFQNRKVFVVFGYMLSTLTRPFYILTGGVAGALGLQVTDRIGKGFRDAPRDAIISFSTPKEELGRSFGYHRAMDTIGAVLGPLIAYLILRFYPLHFNAVFLTSFFVGILTIITLFFISDVVIKGTLARKNIFSAFKALSWQFKLYIFSIFILSIGSLPVAIILLKTQSIGLIIADIPLFYMIYNLSYAGLSSLAGKMSDKFGARKIIFIGYVTLLISYFFLNISESSWTLAFSFLLLGLFPALTDGVQRMFASQISNEEVRGSAMGLLNASIGFGVLIAGISGGFIWQTFGSSIAFIVSALVIIFGLTIFFTSSIKKSQV